MTCLTIVDQWYCSYEWNYEPRARHVGGLHYYSTKVIHEFKNNGFLFFFTDLDKAESAFVSRLSYTKYQGGT